MFQGLRQGSPLFILSKGEPKIEIGEVVSVSNPVPMYPTSFQQNTFMPQSTVDVTARVNGEEVCFQKLRADLSIADTNAGSVVVSDNREAMISEIESFEKHTDQRLTEMPKLQHIKEECPKMLAMLSPQMKRDEQQAKEIESLKNGMSILRDDISNIKDMLVSALKNSKEN